MLVEKMLFKRFMKKRCKRQIKQNVDSKSNKEKRRYENNYISKEKVINNKWIDEKDIIM